MSLPAFPVTDRAVVAKVYEIIDVANADRFRDDLSLMLRSCRGARAVVVDLRTRCLTTAGVEALEAGQELAHRLELRLLVAAPHALTRRVLRITEADRCLEVHTDLPAALQAA
ncbi:STAS domain-containing protein [Actinomycetota bacterium Odt1-20B]